MTPRQRSHQAPALLLLAVLLAAAGATGCVAARQAQPAPPPALSAWQDAPVEPKALELLKQTSDRLAAARSMSFTAVASYEHPSRLGPPIVYAVRYDVSLRRPDRLKVVIPGDGPTSEFTYDGKEMAAYIPGDNLLAVAPAPPDMDAALKAAFETAAIGFPFTDLILTDPYAALAEGAKMAFVMGKSEVIGGVSTDVVVWADDDVFLQIWIGAKDKLPRRFRAIYREDPLRLRHDLELSAWKIDQPWPRGEWRAKPVAPRSIEFDKPALPPGMGMNPGPGLPGGQPQPTQGGAP
ncbi:DUF2092 domain-containing protein [Fundidesulfovibrio agrisoli]|uniref:DUF2092 domain-containing protein n=1 Tax=Fundidesulfovibrio agrisoli TaxID=2922717 RepID=UPI001FAB6A9E|nr:DUF2092 domain-containing protein [Fundidesulfovibrio agrisoli]